MPCMIAVVPRVALSREIVDFVDQGGAWDRTKQNREVHKRKQSIKEDS